MITYYIASYVPETVEFAVLGLFTLAKDLHVAQYPLVKKTQIANYQFISRSYDDIYLIPMTSRVEHATKQLEIPMALSHEDFLIFSTKDIQDFKLDIDKEIIFLNYPQAFNPSVDHDVTLKIHRGNLYRRKFPEENVSSETQYNSVFTDRWEPLVFTFGLTGWALTDALSTIIQLMEQTDNEN